MDTLSGVAFLLHCKNIMFRSGNMLNFETYGSGIILEPIKILPEIKGITLVFGGSGQDSGATAPSCAALH
ncbi:MAG TPA: hypothetical protein VF649_01825 [Sphingomonas sp.]|jgi:hypothetical protein|uniref:hypothetical protein n=1 Tax=Sphingomonas sp. TaxID=28214 RepID=UPI002ED92CA2